MNNSSLMIIMWQEKTASSKEVLSGESLLEEINEADTEANKKTLSMLSPLQVNHALGTIKVCQQLTLLATTWDTGISNWFFFMNNLLVSELGLTELFQLPNCHNYEVTWISSRTSFFFTIS